MPAVPKGPPSPGLGAAAPTALLGIPGRRTFLWAPSLTVTGSGAVIKHPIRSEPFPSAPSPPAYSLLPSLFLVESFSYKWYLCNLARMFRWAGRIVH